MAAETNIAWCDSTFNPVIGCTKVGPGCDHCYAEALMDTRWERVHWGQHQPRKRTSVANWKQPRRWNRSHEKFFAQHGRRRRVFCGSLCDIFDNEWPPEWRADLFDLIDATPHLDWLLLTKRIGNVPKMLKEVLRFQLPANVWLGATIVNQEEADRDIPKLLAAPASTRFLSMEPLMGSVNLRRISTHGGWYDALAGWRDVRESPAPEGEIDWVIVGGESGPHARAMNIQWARGLRDQCANARAGTAFFMKQLGGYPDKRDQLEDLPPDLRIRQFPEVNHAV